MVIDKDMSVEELKSQVHEGIKHFFRIDFGEGDLCDENLEDTIFEECILSVDFSKSNLRNSKFLRSNIKCCNFSFSDLTNALIINCSLEGVNITEAKIEGLSFKSNYCYSKVLEQCDISLLKQ